MIESLESLIASLKDKGRWHPMPSAWNKLYEMLEKPDDMPRPAAPLILAAWQHSTHLQKHARFIEHLKWAEQQGQLNEIGAYLRNLSDAEWHEP